MCDFGTIKKKMSLKKKAFRIIPVTSGGYDVLKLLFVLKFIRSSRLRDLL